MDRTQRRANIEDLKNEVNELSYEVDKLIAERLTEAEQITIRADIKNLTTKLERTQLAFATLLNWDGKIQGDNGRRELLRIMHGEFGGDKEASL